MSVNGRLILIRCLFVCFWRNIPQWVMVSSFTRFLEHTQLRTPVSRVPLDEWSARRRDFYLTTHNTHNREISITSAEFEPTISAGERPQTYALDRAATGTGIRVGIKKVNWEDGWTELGGRVDWIERAGGLNWEGGWTELGGRVDWIERAGGLNPPGFWWENMTAFGECGNESSCSFRLIPWPSQWVLSSWWLR
jgi:hypothetical protein